MHHIESMYPGILKSFKRQITVNSGCLYHIHITGMYICKPVTQGTLGKYKLQHGDTIASD